MDNIQKLILGVLGVSGMLAMVVPTATSSLTEPPPAVEAAPVAEQITVPEATTEPVPDEATQESELTDEDLFMIGEPAIDGNPIQGQPNADNQPPPAAPEQYSRPPAINYAQPPVVADSSAQPAQPPVM